MDALDPASTGAPPGGVPDVSHGARERKLPTTLPTDPSPTAARRFGAADRSS
ncbi:hypothetical protein AwMethylo_36140 [Methylobacterium sp.]|nr:hypothetical protein AwMethylo_36140 [Methylobacterium sp.]